MKRESARTFKEWIDLIGSDKIAKKLDCNKVTVLYWRQGRSPSVRQMKQIRKLTKGVIGYEQILDGKPFKVAIHG